jgi:hypothetical protein
MTLATALYGVGIKSIQAGTITIAHATASNTATISSVNTAKSFVIHNGVTTINNPGSGYTVDDWSFRVALTNATTVTATRGGSDQQIILAYTVVEYN